MSMYVDSLLEAVGLDSVFCFSCSWFAEFPVISIILLLVLIVDVSYYISVPRNLPPGPWTIPWVGWPYRLSDNIHHDLNNLGKKYGEIYTLMMGKRPVIVLNSNRLINEALVKRGEEFANCPAMHDVDYMKMQNNIFSSALFRKKTKGKDYMEMHDELFNISFSQRWREKKEVMVRMLEAAGSMSNKVDDTFLTHLDTMYLHLEKETPVSMSEPLQKVLAATMGDIIYSGGYSDNDPELLSLMALSLEWMSAVYQEGLALGYWNDEIPDSVNKKIQPSMMDKMLSANRSFQKFLVHKVHDHRAVLNNPREVINGYLAEKRDDTDIPDLAFSSTILMLFPDSIESTCSFLQFILFYLAHHPEWQQKVQYQLDHACGGKQPVLAEREKLSMVDATIYEVGRIASVVCLTMAHGPAKSTTLEGYNIPANSYILGNIWAAHMNKDLFPQGDTFSPETLIDKEGKFIANDKILMFSAGHRQCLGSQMVEKMAFLFLTTTLQRYTVSFPKGEPLPPLSSEGGLIRKPLPHKVCFTPRSITSPGTQLVSNHALIFGE